MKAKLQSQVLELVGKNWSKASLTREKLISGMKSFAAFLEKNYGLEKIGDLKPGHIEGYVASMKAAGLSPSTMCGRMTAVRVVAKAVAKQGIVSRANIHYGIERVRCQPQPVNHEKLAEIRAAIAAKAEAGHQVALMTRAADGLRQAFGLRAKESLMSHKVVSRDGKEYLVVEGAKGGRPRDLEISTSKRAAAVALVRETAARLESKTGRIIPPSLTLKQAYDAQRNLWRSQGGTREAGANMHGERHGHAREMKAEGATNAEIMEELGHGEDRSPAAYGV